MREQDAGGENCKVTEHLLATPGTMGFVLMALGYLPQQHFLLCPPGSISGSSVDQENLLDHSVWEMNWL